MVMSEMRRLKDEHSSECGNKEVNKEVNKVPVRSTCEWNIGYEN